MNGKRPRRAFISPQRVRKPESLRARFERHRGAKPFPFKQAKRLGSERAKKKAVTVWAPGESAYQRHMDESAERRSMVIEKHEAGVRQVDIAKELGVSRQRISQIVVEYSQSKA